VPTLNPDFIVVVIDESDIGDDTLRYKHLINYDHNNRILGVRETPVNREFQEGLHRIRSCNFFILRLPWKFYYTRFQKSKLIKNYHRDFNVNDDNLAIVRLPEGEARVKYSKQISMFEKNIQDLADTLIESMDNPHRILIVRHPHLGHLQATSSGKNGWNHISRDILSRVMNEKKIRFYDAESDLREAFGNSPADFYFLNDMHFNFRGLKIYGDLISQELKELACLNKGIEK